VVPEPLERTDAVTGQGGVLLAPPEPPGEIEECDRLGWHVLRLDHGRLDLEAHLELENRRLWE
jgi:hypothetical protein